MVTDLYQRFERDPLREELSVHFGDCCDYSAAVARVRAKPLREHSLEDLEWMIWSGGENWGEPEDFKHFLPRIFELLASQGGSRAPSSLLGRFVLKHLHSLQVLGKWEVMLDRFLSWSWSPEEEQLLGAHLADLRPTLTPKLAARIRARFGEDSCLIAGSA